MLAGMIEELPKNLYGMLLEAAVEVLNHMPTSKHNLATPAMMVSGKKLDLPIQKLIPFGTVRRKTFTFLPVLPRPFPWPVKPNRTEADGPDINTIADENNEGVRNQLNDEDDNFVLTTDWTSSSMETDSEEQGSNEDTHIEEEVDQASLPARSEEVIAKEVETADANTGHDTLVSTDDAQPVSGVSESEQPVSKVSEVELPASKSDEETEMELPDINNREETKSDSVEALTASNTVRNKDPAQDPVRGRRLSQKLLDSYKTSGNQNAKSFAKAYRISMGKALKSDRSEESKEAAAEEIKNMLQYNVGHYVSIGDIPLTKGRIFYRASCL
jgi:hypothetical protein